MARRGSILAILASGLAAVCCAGPPPSNSNDNGLWDNQNTNATENANSSDNLNHNDNLPDNSNLNAPPGENGNLNDNGSAEDPNLHISLGDHRDVDASETVALEATIDNPRIDADYYYLWEYTFDEEERSAAALEEYVRNWNQIAFVPSLFFPDTDFSTGRTITIRVSIQEVIGAKTSRQGDAEVDLFVLGGEVVEEGGGGGGGGGPFQQPHTNANFAVDEIVMALSDEFLFLEPIVSGGVPPYSYLWEPREYLQDSGGFGGSAEHDITTPDADFIPPSTGDWNITVTVTDDSGKFDDATITIHVNDYLALSADAGDDQSVAEETPVTLQGSATGGSGSYTYDWSPSGTPTGNPGEIGVNTDNPGVETYTLTVTDTDTEFTASDTVRVVVYAESGGSCTDSDIDMSVGAAQSVAFDAGFNPDGQALVVSNSSLLIYDLSDNSLRASLSLAADGRALAVDPIGRWGFVSTQIAGQSTRSVQLVDLDAATLGSNIALPASVAAARGMAVIPSTGELLVAVSGSNHGLIKVDPNAGTANEELQNQHTPGSFRQPIDVAVLEEGGLSVAVVANAGNSVLTVVPLDDIDETPDNPGGSGIALDLIAVGGLARAIAADPAREQVLVSWSDGSEGRLQLVGIEESGGTYSGSMGTVISSGSAVSDQGLEVDTVRQKAFAATGSSGAAIVDLGLEAIIGTLEAESTTAGSVAAAFDHQGGTSNDTVLIVGLGDYLSGRCP